MIDSPTMSHSEAPSEPGWYDDPDGKRGIEVYWNGERWSGAPRKKAPEQSWSGILTIVVGTIVFTVLIGLVMRYVF